MTAINPHAVRVVSDLRGVSVSQLAREADLDRSSLSTALNGGPRRIPADKLLDIARVLMVDPRALLGPDEVRTKSAA